MSPSNTDGMRASDSDREGAVAVLIDAYAADRLNLGDMRDRAGVAYRAQTWGDLRKLTIDLGPGRVFQPAPAGSAKAEPVAQKPDPFRNLNELTGGLIHGVKIPLQEVDIGFEGGGESTEGRIADPMSCLQSLNGPDTQATHFGNPLL